MTEETDPAPGRSSGFALILGATAVGGAAGYVITWLVPRAIGFESYAPFAIFWAFLFLVISALSGIQQEITRATHVAESGAAQRGRAARVAVVVGFAVLAIVLLSSLIWAHWIFPASSVLALPLALGAASYVAVAVLYGTLYGTHQWRSLFLLVVTEALARLVLIGIVLGAGGDLLLLAWAVAVPIPLALLIAWPYVRRTAARQSKMDIGYRGLAWNVARTVTASTSMGVLISGLPLVLGLTSGDVPPGEFGLMISAVTLTRAPLIVVAMALQSFLVVRFRSHSRPLALLRRLVLIVVGVAALLGVLGYLAGPFVFQLLFPGGPVPSSSLIGALVGSSALVAILCLTGSAVLARSLHLAYSAGWLTAALVTLACVLLPLPFETRTLIALFAGPIAGIVIHLVAARRGTVTATSAI